MFCRVSLRDCLNVIVSMNAAKLKSRIHFLHRVPSGHLFRIDSGVQALPMCADKIAIMSAFWTLQK